jgi:signal transduction histidine kinase/CheY-like chemotaxis protein
VQDRVIAQAHSRIAPYGVAVGAAFFAAGANAILWPNFGIRYPLIAFYPAITISAWFGGLWPGVICTILSSIVAAFVWLDPRFSLRITPGADAIALLVFVGVGGVISVLCESLRTRASRERAARDRAERAEALLATELADTQRLYKLSEMLLAAGEVADILKEVLRAAIDLLNADKGDVRIHHEADDCLRVVAHVGFSDTEQLVDTFRSARGRFSMAGETLRLRKQIIIEGAARDSTFVDLAEICALHELASVVSTPILGSDGESLGTLSTYFREPHRPSDRELRVLDLYIQQGGYAIERSRLLEAERFARREAEQANQLKDRFLSIVSHDLRAPLNAVLGWADMLRSGRLSEARRARAFQAVYDNAQRQVRLIGDLLDVSRIMSGTLRLERTAVNLSTVIQGALDVVELQAAEKAIELVVDDNPKIGTFYGDPARLQQVVWNLLSNAIKFTPQGGAVHVRIRVRGQFVEIVVRDTGGGISREFLPFVFEPFRQADASPTRSHGGLGLGLAIVKHLVEGHGGTVHAESDGQDHGAVFTVRLPIVPVDANLSNTVQSPISVESNAIEPSLLQGIAVLIVDDDADSRDLISATLEDGGASVIIASSAAEAVGHLSRQRFDVLIADIAMPDEDGYTLIDRVRATPAPEVARIPAIALTSLSRDEDRKRALSAGFQLHLPKPADARLLARSVATVVHHIGT